MDKAVKMRKPFIFMPSFIESGVSMKAAFAVAIMAAMALYLVSIGCYAESSGYFTSVGGEYGESVISKFKSSESATDESAADESSEDAGSEEDSGSDSDSGLWSWGSSPKGSLMIDGGLIADPTYSKKLNVNKNWLEDTYVDPYGGSTSGYTYTDAETGEPVQTYVDQNGRSYYTYTDSSTNKLVYVYFNPYTGEPTSVSFTPLAATNTSTSTKASGYSLPSIFTTGYP